MQFLKDIERDMKQMNLSAEQKEVRMLKLQAIEETPHPAYLPEEQETMRKMARLREKFSMRVPLAPSDGGEGERKKPDKEMKVTEESHRERVQNRLADRMYEISRMLVDMQIKSLNEVEPDAHSHEGVERPEVTADAYRTILE